MATIFSEWKRCVSLAVLVLVVAVFAFLVPVRSEAASSDCFLKISGIPGESVLQKHYDEIDVLTWGFGESNASAAASTAGRAGGKVQMQDLRFTARMGKHSPKLFLAVANGMHFPEAVLTCHRAEKDYPVYVVVKFRNVILTGYQTGTPIPTGTQTQAIIDPYSVDQVTLNSPRIEVEYFPRAGTPVRAGWDVQTNTPFQ